MTDSKVPAPRPAPYRIRIRHWYRGNGRELPWRGIRNPYRILISEIMLQQTQVSRVLEKYPAFVRQFSSFRALAGASRAEVIRAWRGLGYNNRAVRLHRLARTVRELPGGRLPGDAGELLRLPGIGKYTAHAILCSAFGQRAPAVDINVRRLFSRLFWRMPSTDSLRPEEEIWQLAWRILPRTGVYEWSQALMDLGALVCTSRAPRCGICPVAELCRSRRSMRRGDHRTGPKEPSWNGIPDRIHRGKIVELLCTHNSPVTVSVLARVLSGNGRRPPVAWLAALLSGLERDGVVRVAPGATPRQQRVTLA